MNESLPTSVRHLATFVLLLNWCTRFNSGNSRVLRRTTNGCHVGLSFGQTRRDEVRILERSTQLRRQLFHPDSAGEVWPNESHVPEGSVQSTDDTGMRFFEVPSIEHLC